MLRTLAFAALLLAALPARAQMPDGLAGTWTLHAAVVEPDAPASALLAQAGLRTATFSTSGTAVVRLGIAFPYAVEGDTLVINAGDERMPFRLDGDSLALGDPDGRDGRFHHVRRTPGDGLIGQWQIVRIEGGGEGPEGYAGMEFLASGLGALLFDAVVGFSVEGDRLSIAISFRNGPPEQTATLRLDGDTLELTQDGASGTFTRTQE